MSRHANISVFVPHIGCTHRCSFCNQFSITGQTDAPDEKDVAFAVETALHTPHFDPAKTEIAFFGGSFTAIDREYMLSLLRVGYDYVQNGTVCGIRISTRPDCIDHEILSVLKQYGVHSIEIGAQCTNDTVLLLNRRGHTSEDIFRASSLIKNNGFSLGLQMMYGLYGSNDEIDRQTVRDFITIHPDTVRIYPTVVLKNTALADLYYRGEYLPPKLDSAVKSCSDFSVMFERAEIKVIRLGLHSIDKTAYIAGPWHPAFSQLCRSFTLLCLAREKLKAPGKYRLLVHPSDLSAMIGQHRENIMRLSADGYLCSVFADSDVPVGTILSEKEV